MSKKIMLLLCAFLFMTTSAFAHVMNKNNVFSDLSLTEAADEVVLLSALGVISYLDDNFEFKPTEKLTAKDLAAWVAGYNGVEGETSEALAKAAVDEGLISTMEGDATYALVNEALFLGQLELDNAEATMTREEFAVFVASHVHRDMGGHTLLDMSGYEPGPTGIIEHVERVQKKTASGSSAYVYMMTIDGTVYEVGMHPRVLAESADPAVWVGQLVAESFIGPNVGTDKAGKHMHHDHDHADPAVAEQVADMADDTVADKAIQFIVIGEEPFTVKVESVAIVEQTPAAEASAVEEALKNVETIETEQGASPNALWIIVGIIAVLAISAGVMVKKSKKA